MNNRIYTDSLFEKAINQMRIEWDRYCPVCFSETNSFIYENKKMLFKCENKKCNHENSKFLRKDELRDKKIERILE